MTGLTAAQAAQLGAGQTIYIVDAYHDPNVAAELAAFNQKFGLPGCTAKTLAATSTLPLAAPATNACELVLAYNTASGTLTGTAPAYNSGWATEITLRCAVGACNRTAGAHRSDRSRRCIAE
jgi:hypothetical protein